MQLDESSRGPALKEIMRKKLGHLFEWRAPKLKKTVGPYDPKVFEFYREKCKALEDEVRSVLLDLSDSDIDVLFYSDRSDESGLRREWNRLLGDKIAFVARKEPPWFAGGLGVEGFLAEFDYWSKVPSFTAHEAVALSLGIEPKHISAENLFKAKEEMENGQEPWPAISYMVARREQVDRQFFIRSSKDKIVPKDLFGWFDQVALDIHPEFTSKYLNPRNAPTTEPVAAKTDHREKSSMLRLIISMAVGGYGYRPGEGRSTCPKEIEGDAAELGIDISAETIRKYLRSGEACISDDWKQPKS